MSRPNWTIDEIRAVLHSASLDLQRRAVRWEQSSCRDAAWLEDGDDLLEELRPQLEARHMIERSAVALVLIEERAGRWVL